MFGYRGGESKETVLRKVGYRRDAQERWPFLTTLDLSTIHNEVQLVTMVRDRTSTSRPQAEEDVRGWIKRKRF